jgi:hypothetical protein
MVPLDRRLKLADSPGAVLSAMNTSNGSRAAPSSLASPRERAARSPLLAAPERQGEISSLGTATKARAAYLGRRTRYGSEAGVEGRIDGRISTVWLLLARHPRAQDENDGHCDTLAVRLH